VLDSVEQALAAQTSIAETEMEGVSKYLPELQYNVRLLADLAAGSLANTDRRLKQDTTNVNNWKHQYQQLKARVDSDSSCILLQYLTIVLYHYMTTLTY